VPALPSAAQSAFPVHLPQFAPKNVWPLLDNVLPKQQKEHHKQKGAASVASMRHLYAAAQRFLEAPNSYGLLSRDEEPWVLMQPTLHKLLPLKRRGGALDFKAS
jgi:hypothetical protein